MCGIAGLLRVGPGADPGEQVARMVSAQAHRGPDGEGLWCDGSASIGHRRLAIIDLASGRQPMANEDGTVWITFNGEIYNYRDLRDELEGSGHRFATRSDTEVILHAYEQWGDDCVNALRGMFAFGIVDRAARRLFLARDPFGIKPLVYYRDAGRFAFASEIRALARLPGAELDVDLLSLDRYLWLQYIPAPGTIYRNVRKLPPAHRMSVSFDGRVQGPEAYWRLEFRPDERKSQADFEAELEAVLRESVKAHLVADVPFGAFLSGGVDSSAVVAFMAEELSEPVRSFSIGFEGQDYDELPYAAEVSRKWGTEHHVEIVGADVMGDLPDLVAAFGEPFGDSSALPTHYVSRLARRCVPMVLSGDGGDETFAGYHSYRQWMAYVSLPPPEDRPSWRTPWRKAVGLLDRVFSPAPPGRGERLADWLRLVNYLPSQSRAALWRPEHRAVVDQPLECLEEAFREACRYGGANRVQYLDFASYLPSCILTKVDIASMMTGLEVRTPFLDRRVVEFAATIPEAMNLGRGSDGEWEGKRLLKNILGKYYSPELLHRYKRGFSVPLGKWLFEDPAAAGEVRRRLTGSGSRLFEFFEAGAIARLIEAQQAGPVWLLLFLEEWLRQSRPGA